MAKMRTTKATVMATAIATIVPEIILNHYHDEDVADDEDDSGNDNQTSLIIYSDSVNDDSVPCCRLCWRS